MNKLPYIIGMAALAANAIGCALVPQKEYTKEEKIKAYYNLCESCKDGVSALEARAASSMYFDSIDVKADEPIGAMAPKDNLMKKINQFYDSNGELIAYAQKKEGEGRNAKLQSLGGRNAVHTGITLREFKTTVEELYKENQPKIDEILRGVAGVSWNAYARVAHDGQKFNTEDWNTRFFKIEPLLFEKLLNRKRERFGPENDPANQINKGDGNFVLYAVSALVPEKE